MVPMFDESGGGETNETGAPLQSKLRAFTEEAVYGTMKWLWWVFLLVPSPHWHLGHITTGTCHATKITICLLYM